MPTIIVSALLASVFRIEFDEKEFQHIRLSAICLCFNLFHSFWPFFQLFILLNHSFSESVGPWRRHGVLHKYVPRVWFLMMACSGIRNIKKHKWIAHHVFVRQLEINLNSTCWETKWADWIDVCVRNEISVLLSHCHAIFECARIETLFRQPTKHFSSNEMSYWIVCGATCRYASSITFMIHS